MVEMRDIQVSTLKHQSDFDPRTVLPENVPLSMPELPLTRVINTLQQFKAINDPIRSRILGIIQNQPATAKQIADRLGATPGAIGHHLQNYYAYHGDSHIGRLFADTLRPQNAL